MNRNLSSFLTLAGCSLIVLQAQAQTTNPVTPSPTQPLAPATPPAVPASPPSSPSPSSAPAPQSGAAPLPDATIPGPNIVPDAPITPGETPPIAPNIQPAPVPPPVQLPLPPAPAPSDVAQAPLTADEAALIALRNQPNVFIANANISAAQGRVQQVRAGLGPTVGVGTGYTNVSNISGDATSGGGTASTPVGSVVTSAGYTASTNVRQLLYDFNRTRNLVRQATLQQRAAEANLTQVQGNLVLQVKQAFYVYAQDQQLIQVQEENVSSTQSQLTLAQARLGVGTGLPSDVVRAQTSVADAVFNLEQARNAAAIASTILALTMGIDARTPIQVAPNIEATEPTEPAANVSDINALVTTALRQRPEVRQAQANIQAANYGVKAAKTNNYPSIDFNVGIAARNTTFPPNNSNFSAGVALEWNPFDNGLTRGLVREAQAAQVTAQQQLLLANQTVVADVSQAYLNLRTAEQRVTTATAEVANAQESLRLAVGRYRGGVGTFLDVVTAETALVTAQTNRITSLSTVDQSRAALSRSIGANLPANLPALPH